MLRAVAAKSVACAVAGNTTTAAAARATILDMAWSVLTRRKRLRHIFVAICDERALLAPMIRRSDDTAAARIRDRLGNAALVRLARVALLTHGDIRLSVAVLPAANGSHATGTATLEGIFRRLLQPLSTAGR